MAKMTYNLILFFFPLLFQKAHEQATIPNFLENTGLFFCFLNLFDKNTVFEYGLIVGMLEVGDFLRYSDIPLQLPICIQSSGEDFGEPLCFVALFFFVVDKFI